MTAEGGGEGANRREVVRAGISLSGAAALAAVPLLARAEGALAQGGDDAAIVVELLELEQRAGRAYQAISKRRLVEPELIRAIDLFADQEREHVAALSAALEDLGGSPPKPPRREEIEGLGDLESEKDALEFAIGLENELVRAYDDAAGRFARSDLLLLAAQIVCNQAQHLAVLRQQLGEEPIPDAFEEGAQKEFG